MASAINRNTFEVRRSVDTTTPEFSDPPWLQLSEADADAAELIQQQYRIINPDDTVREATQAEKDAIDQGLVSGELTAEREREKARVDDAVGEMALRGMVEVLTDEINVVRSVAVPPLRQYTVSEVRAKVENVIDRLT